jgi:hypothetical protein
MPTNFQQAYLSLDDYAREHLGAAMGIEQVLPGGGHMQQYANGGLYLAPDATDIFAVYGAIYQRWVELGAQGGTLGFPQTNELEAGMIGNPTAPPGRGSHFQHGSIYWSPATGAHEIQGAIRDAYSSMYPWSWELGFGYPLTGETILPALNVRANIFHLGSIYWDQSGIEPAQVVPNESKLLLIVGPEQFRVAAQRLVAHKRQTGIPALFVSIETIKRAYHTDFPTLPGTISSDDALAIKTAVGDAARYLNAGYLMLLGDASLVPVRWITLHWGWSDACYKSTDFYYANLWKVRIGRTNEVPLPDRGVDTWDANHDRHYNEMLDNSINRFNPDQVLPISDIAVGRVPAHDVGEVEKYVTKIIQYETAVPNAARFDVAELLDHGYGGVAGMADIMERQAARSTSWNQNFTRWGFGFPDDGSDSTVHRAPPHALTSILAQSRLVVYIGHGGMDGWEIGVGITQASAFSNIGRLPVVIACGCETAPIVPVIPAAGVEYQDESNERHQYNATGTPLQISDRGVALNWQPTSAQPKFPLPRPALYDVPERAGTRFAAAWLFNENGGAIVYIGEAEVNQDNWPATLAGNVVRAYRGPGTILGDMWRAGQNAYYTEALNDDQWMNQVNGAPRVFLPQMTLYGDPSLRLP